MQKLLYTIISPLYILVIFIISILFFTFTLWFPQHRVFVYVLHADQFTIFEKFSRITEELSFAIMAQGYIMVTMTILLAILTGINIALIIIYMKKQTKLRLIGGSSLAGVVVGLLGVGCASCGAVILTTVLGIGFATTILSYLPLHGVEFGMIAIGLLSCSIYRTGMKIVSSEVCVVRLKR